MGTSSKATAERPGPVVIAIGGNAISGRLQEGTTIEQRSNLREAVKGLVRLITHGHRLVLTHGNGPQVGRLLQRMELSREQVPPLALDLCGALSQGQLGYLLEQELRSAISKANLRDPPEVATVVTQVEVDPADPGMAKPTKPIGPFLSLARADALRAEGAAMVEVEPGSWRRVVASPRPKRILQLGPIRGLVDSGVLVICCGGGGVPVMRDQRERLLGVEGVIDKDLASSLLARELGARMLAILTDVPKVLLDYRTTRALELTRMTSGEARRLLAHDYFPPGSMGPKITAAVEFVEATDGEAVITSIDQASRIFEVEVGTHLRKGPDRQS